MSTAGAARVPRTSGVSVGALLAAGAAASAVSTPPAREHAEHPDPLREGAEGSERAAAESEAA
ncbi:hypothetical protein J7F03_01785 [Streptomyces sp. ISL-43]|uniref:hypothetical protein n=1 Tax=Streptomyces sp. ISL-43 TaxID=2819183 RepID=UPI001BED24AE|nr:hypothetical protein [Streptomyces sp. ISL-43]MBT2445837.1 hypothetical protein [Streptomyces sp. ISL-43]